MNANLSLEVPNLIGLDNTIRFAILFRANEKKHNFIFCRNSIYHTIMPGDQILKRAPIAEIKAEEDAVGRAVKHFCDGVEVFLPCSVPNLQFQEVSVVEFEG